MKHVEVTEELTDEMLSSVVGGCPGHEDIMPADEPEPPPRPRKKPVRTAPAAPAERTPRAPRAAPRNPRGGGTSADGFLNGMDLDFFKFNR